VKDPTCKCDANGKCEPCTDPKDPTCGGGGGGGCDPVTDSTCKCDVNGKCEPCTDPKDPKCSPICDDPKGKQCAPPAACDPSDPVTCKDSCEVDPVSCGCPSKDPACWDVPGKPACDATGKCAAAGALMPERPPVDFGCVGPS
jgi:hypothetical protein